MNLHSVFPQWRKSRVDAVLTRAGLQLQSRPRFGRIRVLVARSLLRVRQQALRLDLSGADRVGALRAQALAWQPFERSEVRLGVVDTDGLLLGWDIEAAAAAAASAGLNPADVDWLAEPAWQTAGDGFRLLAGADGFEGQFWQKRFLLASRWWPERPNESDWSDFVRTTPGAGLTEGMPAPESIEFPPRPWLALHGLEMVGNQALRAERWLVGAGSLLLIAATAGVGREASEGWRQRSTLQSQLEELKLATKPALMNRERAQQAGERVQRMAGEMMGVQPLDVLRYLAEHLPKDGVTLRELDLEGRTLRLSFEIQPGISRSVLVERLQGGGWFGTVSEQQGALQANWISYVVTLAADQPPVVSQAAEPASAVGAGGKP